MKTLNTLAATLVFSLLFSSPLFATSPVVTDASTSVDEDVTLQVSSGLELSNFFDADGDLPVMFKVVNLPANGTLEYQGGSVIAGQEISTATVTDLEYTPDPNYNGPDAFDFNISDGTSYAVSDATYNITVNAVNDPATDITITIINADENTVAGTTVALLSNDDPDLGDIHTYTLVPGIGGTHNNLVSIVGNKLQVFVPFDYETHSLLEVRLEVTDTAGAATQKLTTIAVNDLNDLPVVSTFPKVVDQGVLLAFDSTDFITNYTDDDKDALSRVRITDLPDWGTLELGGVPVLLNDEIAKALLANLAYTSISNFHGVDEFEWEASDGAVYSGNRAKVEIEVNMDRSAIITGSSPLDDVTTNPGYLGSFIVKPSMARDSIAGNVNPSQGTGFTRPGLGNGIAPDSAAQGNKSELTTDVENVDAVAESFSVGNSYPNPFTTHTTIAYELPMDYNVSIKVYNILGKEVATVIEEPQSRGSQKIVWNAQDQGGNTVQNGQYIYIIRVSKLDGTFVAAKTGMLSKVR